VPRLVTLLQALGIVISKRQVVRLLIDGQDCFLDEARDPDDRAAQLIGSLSVGGSAENAIGGRPIAPRMPL